MAKRSPRKKPSSGGCGRLLIVLGDQLDPQSRAIKGLNPANDRVWMAEVDHEATRHRCHLYRLVAFFSAMRHFRDELIEAGYQVQYHELTDVSSRDQGRTFSEVLRVDLQRLRPTRIEMIKPGDAGVEREILETIQRMDVPIDVLDDDHFLLTPAEFDQWADNRKTLVMEHFYRMMRRKHRVLMADDDQPVGGQWNLDHENRRTFGKNGPVKVPRPRSFPPDDTTSAVIQMVKKRYAGHPGTVETFDLPVTARNARLALEDFIEHRLPLFGRFEDAMWTDEPLLYHSRLSFPLNVKLLNPRDCIRLAVDALERGHAPLNSVEGFVRQIIGWREFVRGVYWRHMPDYLKLNALEHEAEVPESLWTGKTEMACVRHVMKGVLDTGYAHHIQRLMVLGLYCQLLGVHPRKFHEWHMAMYVDAVDWVSLPNTLGMSQWGDGGIMATKPYCAGGGYIDRMSNYCRDCRFNPARATGKDACPLTTLYWDFL
ncbi:MAG: cryptochrome/photolyase family protein, partial [Phycisphaeraceae bacterium]|nr:cryptochrome/photolyase family protein [Phycisphaeraceae bacterium]